MEADGGSAAGRIIAPFSGGKGSRVPGYFLPNVEHKTGARVGYYFLSYCLSIIVDQAGQSGS